MTICTSRRGIKRAAQAAGGEPAERHQRSDNEFGNGRDAHIDMTTALDGAGDTDRSGFGESEHADTSDPQGPLGDDLRGVFAETVAP